MAETHELRLKIDAAAAKRGSREFTAAVNAIKLAVRDLERDSTGAFTRLKKNMDDVAKRGKMKVSGVDRQSIRDLNDYASAQLKIVNSTANSAKGIKTLITTMRGLSDSYSAARTTSEGFSTSIQKTNSALNRQIQLASQARSAVRQVRTAPVQADTGASAGAAASVAALRKEYASLNKLVASTSAMIASSYKLMTTGATQAAAGTRQATAAASRMENVQLSAAAAIRRAEQEAVRLIARLREMGDTRGASAINQALIQLKGNLSGGVASALSLRKAMDQFAQSTSTAKVSLSTHNSAQAAAASNAKRLATQYKATASAARNYEATSRSIAGSTNAASQAFRRATGSMRGLENAFNASFQVGSAFRQMMGAITLGTFTQSVFAAGDALDQFRVTMEVATGSSAAAAGEMDYIEATANRLGVGLKSARDNYSKFAIAADLAGIQADQTRRIFESVSTSMAVLGRSTEDQNLAFMALEQMMSKGTISSEELRRQLGERLPGAVQMMADAIGVTTAELQKLLKAGEISSADALPKFAEVLMERFGPGLEKATKRAGFNLGTLRNEITLFQEVVAQSGFMQVLAQEFGALTQLMRTEDVQLFAKALGEGFASVAQHATDAAKWIIENIEQIGTTVKAIAGGVVVRQMLLMGAAFTQNAHNFAGWIASIGAGQGAMTAQQIAAERHTTALTANTAAIVGNNTATAAGTKLNAANALSQQAQVTAAMRHTAASGLMAGGLARITGAATAATGTLAFLTRGLTIMAGPIGIALTALMLFPSALNLFRDSAENTSAAVEAAVRRAGVSYEELGETIQQTASDSALSTILSDLDTLDRRVGAFVEDNKRRIDSINIAAAQAAGMDVSVDTGFMGGAIGDAAANRWVAMGREAAGVSEALIASMANADREVFTSLTSMAVQATNTGEGFVNLMADISSAQVSNPGAALALTALKDAYADLATQEMAVTENHKRLVDMYGTDNERLVKSFASTATEVLRTGSGFEALTEQAQALSEETPQIASAINDIVSNLQAAALAGTDFRVYDAAQVAHYNAVAKSLDSARENAVSAGAAAVVAANNSREAWAAFQDDMSGGGFFDFNMAELDSGEMENVQALWDAFQNSDFGVPIEQLQALGTTMGDLPPKIDQFYDSVVRAYSSVREGERSYATFADTVNRLSAEFNDPAVTQFANNLKEMANKTDGAVLSAAELESALNAIDWPDDEAEAAARKIVEFAMAEQQAEAGARAANGVIPNLVANINDVGNAGFFGADGVWAAVSAVRALFSLSGEVMAAGGSLVSGIQENIAIANADGVEKARLQYWSRSGEGGRYESEMQERITDLRAQAGEATTWTERARLSAEATLASATLSATRAVVNGQIGELDAARTAETERNRAAREEAGGGSGADKAAELSDEQKATEKLTETLRDRLVSLQKERVVLDLLEQDMFHTTEAAELMAEAMMQGGGSVDEQTAAMIRQIDASARLNKELQTLANDPVKAWMDSVPNWIEAGQQIEMGAIESLKGALSEFIQTGKFDMESLGTSILGVISDIVADKAVAEMMSLFGREDGGGLGGVLGGLLSSVGDDPSVMGGGGDGAQVAQGGVQAGQSISQAMVQAGQQVSQSLTTAMQQGGTTAANAQRTAGVQTGAQIRTATTTSGQTHATTVRTAIVQGGQQHANAVGQAAASGGGGGMGGAGGGFLSSLGGWGGLASMALGAFSEGGISTSPVGTASMPASAFSNAPHFAQGTTNTSGIPAVLHPNEAVIPLSKGRKIPVDMGDSAGGGSTQIVNQTFNISTPDADSFRRSQKQMAADGASSAQRAMASNR
jgi:tape measure domain-containing protein